MSSKDKFVSCTHLHEVMESVDIREKFRYVFSEVIIFPQQLKQGVRGKTSLSFVPCCCFIITVIVVRVSTWCYFDVGKRMVGPVGCVMLAWRYLGRVYENRLAVNFNNGVVTALGSHIDRQQLLPALHVSVHTKNREWPACNDEWTVVHRCI